MPSDGTQSASGGNTMRTIMGTNQLQSAIDKLASTVDKFDSIVSSMAASSGGQLATMSGGSRNGGGSGPPAPPTTGAPNFSYAGGGNGGYAQGSLTSGGVSGSSGGGTPPPASQGGGGNGGWFSAGTAGGAALGAASGLGGYMITSGSSAMGTMATLSAYVQSQGLNAPNGLANSSTSNKLLAAAGAGPYTLNSIANNAMDAVQGAAYLQQFSGSFLGNNSLGSAMNAGAYGTGILNPGLGYTGSLGMWGQMYSPGTQMQAMMLGLPTFRSIGGGSKSAVGTSLSLIQSEFGGRSLKGISPAMMAAALSTNGHFQNTLQAGYGLSGQNLTAMDQSLKGYLKLANAGYSPGAISNMMAAAGNPESANYQTAKTQLSNAGIDVNSVLQSQKNKNAVQTQNAGEQMNGYQSGLAESTGLLNQFSEALNRLLNGPLGQLTGYGKGYGAGGALQKGMSIFGVGGEAFGAVTSLFSAQGAGGTASGATNGSTRSGGSSIGSSASSKAMTAVRAAESQLGVPYVWGGETPGKGFDCSGLVQWAYSQAGMSIARTADAQYNEFSKNSVPLNQVMAGDLVFTAGSDGTAAAPGHVAMMVNANTLIQAEETGTNIMLTRYDPSQWDHAERPTAANGGGSGMSAANNGSGGSLFQGSAGSGGPAALGSNFGSVDELSAFANALGGASGGGGSFGGFATSAGSSSTTAAGTGSTAGASSPGNLSSTAALARKMAAKYGWTGAQWNALNSVEMAEAGWNLTAKNPSSGAYGIAQFIDGPSEYYKYGGNPNTAKGQVTGFLNYVQQRYGNPEAAWAHEQAYHWYARGTSNANPGWAIVGENGPEAIKLKGGETIQNSSMTSGYMAAAAGGSGGAGTGLAISINFQSGSISVTGGATSTSTSTAQTLGDQIAQQIASALQQNDMIRKIKEAA